MFEKLERSKGCIGKTLANPYSPKKRNVEKKDSAEKSSLHQSSTLTLQRYYQNEQGDQATEGWKYLIKKGREDLLLVAPGAPPPAPERLFLPNNEEIGILTRKTDGSIRYPSWKYNPPENYLNDCVKHAAVLSTTDIEQYCQPPAMTLKGRQGAQGSIEFSDAASYPKNYLLSGSIEDLGEKANPGIGEAYAALRRDNGGIDEETKHHGSTVVAKDGTDNVVNEAMADLKNDPNSKSLPKFKMYGTKEGSGQTFYDAFKDMYSSDSKDPDKKIVVAEMIKRVEKKPINHQQQEEKKQQESWVPNSQKTLLENLTAYPLKNLGKLNFVKLHNIIHHLDLDTPSEYSIDELKKSIEEEGVAGLLKEKQMMSKIILGKLGL